MYYLSVANVRITEINKCIGNIMYSVYTIAIKRRKTTETKINCDFVINAIGR